jgi:hypothetical protein
VRPVVVVVVDIISH